MQQYNDDDDLPPPMPDLVRIADVHQALNEEVEEDPDFIGATAKETVSSGIDKVKRFFQRTRRKAGNVLNKASTKVEQAVAKKRDNAHIVNLDFDVFDPINGGVAYVAIRQADSRLFAMDTTVMGMVQGFTDKTKAVGAVFMRGVDSEGNIPLLFSMPGDDRTLTISWFLQMGSNKDLANVGESFYDSSVKDSKPIAFADLDTNSGDGVVFWENVESRGASAQFVFDPCSILFKDNTNYNTGMPMMPFNRQDIDPAFQLFTIHRKQSTQRGRGPQFSVVIVYRERKSGKITNVKTTYDIYQITIFAHPYTSIRKVVPKPVAVNPATAKLLAEPDTTNAKIGARMPNLRHISTIPGFTVADSAVVDPLTHPTFLGARHVALATLDTRPTDSLHAVSKDLMHPFSDHEMLTQLDTNHRGQMLSDPDDPIFGANHAAGRRAALQTLKSLRECLASGTNAGTEDHRFAAPFDNAPMLHALALRYAPLKSAAIAAAAPIGADVSAPTDRTLAIRWGGADAVRDEVDDTVGDTVDNAVNDDVCNSHIGCFVCGYPTHSVHPASGHLVCADARCLQNLAPDIDMADVMRLQAAAVASHGGRMAVPMNDRALLINRYGPYVAAAQAAGVALQQGGSEGYPLGAWAAAIEHELALHSKSIGILCGAPGSDGATDQGLLVAARIVAAHLFANIHYYAYIEMINDPSFPSLYEEVCAQLDANREYYERCLITFRAQYGGSLKHACTFIQVAGPMCQDKDVPYSEAEVGKPPAGVSLVKWDRAVNHEAREHDSRWACTVDVMGPEDITSKAKAKFLRCLAGDQLAANPAFYEQMDHVESNAHVYNAVLHKRTSAVMAAAGSQ